MSRKGTIDVFQTKTTRNDRYAQMSHQEKLIEQKKKEIQAKLEQKQKTSSSDTKSDNKSKETSKEVKTYNQFSNDGSFLDQFKQMKDKKIDQKLKSFKFSQEKSHSEERNRSNNRWSQRRRSPSPNTSRHKFSRFPDKIQNNEPKISISTSYSNFISQANFNVQTTVSIPVVSENVVGQPLLKNDLPPPTMAFPPPTQTSTTVISALPVMLNVPPPQVIQQSVTMPMLVQQPSLPTTAVVSTIPNANSELSTATIITSLNLPPPTPTIGPQNAPSLGSSLSVLAPETTISNSIAIPPLPSITSVELASIPPPNPIQLQNIPQPEPINTINIPPPAPIQVQNIPPPSPIQLNEIPKPKPIDIINIPTPTEVTSTAEKNMSDPDFIKNIPPPNKSVPPPSLQDTTISANISVPPPNPGLPSISTPAPTCIPPPNVSIPLSQNIPPPPSMTLPSQNMLSASVLPPPNHNVPTLPIPPPPPPQSISSLIIPQNIQENVAPPQAVASQTIIVHSIPPPQNIQPLQLIPQSSIPPQLALQQTSQTLPATSVIPVTLALQSTNPGPTMSSVPTMSGTNVIISQQLLSNNQAQIGVAGPNLNVHCPSPIINSGMQGLQQTFINQPPPLSAHMPPMNIPPPGSVSNTMLSQDFKPLNTVYSPGTAEYEAMASLGRMVAQCGPGIEDVVRQRKQQDPNLWFLFHKESATYQQYQQLIEQFRVEIDNEAKESREMQDSFCESDLLLIKKGNVDLTDKDKDQESILGKRKRRSRWGDKESNIPPPMVVLANPTSPTIMPISAPIPAVPIVRPAPGSVMLSSVTRNEPSFLQYVKQTYGTTDLVEEDWKKAEGNFKVHLLYQEMIRKKQEVEKLAKAGKHKYEYDSDEETDGGTWEHKLREKEMQKTQQWAVELTKNAEGKHHIGDFLPPEELQKFLEKNKNKIIGDGSDYKDFKIKDDNIGFKMLQKLGWSEGQGLGANASGIVDPVNKATVRDQNQGLGLAIAAVDDNDDEYESYRKRMMLAYRFRPNPLNNPRRPYY